MHRFNTNWWSLTIFLLHLIFIESIFNRRCMYSHKICMCCRSFYFILLFFLLTIHFRQFSFHTAFIELLEHNNNFFVVGECSAYFGYVMYGFCLLHIMENI